MNLIEILEFNSKSLRFVVNEHKKLEVIQNFTNVLSLTFLNLDDCASKIYVNEIFVNEQLIKKI